LEGAGRVVVGALVVGGLVVGSLVVGASVAVSDGSGESDLVGSEVAVSLRRGSGVYVGWADSAASALT
jgi:hypothetical protein